MSSVRFKTPHFLIETEGINKFTSNSILFYTSLLPDDQETMSEVAYPSSRSRFQQPARHSSRAMMPLRRLDTLKEVPSVNMLDESTCEGRDRTGPGASRTKSSSSDSHVPAPHRYPHSSVDDDNSSANNMRNGHQEAEAGEQQQPSSSTPAWAAEPRDNAEQNPLLRRPRWNPKKM